MREFDDKRRHDFADRGLHAFEDVFLCSFDVDLHHVRELHETFVDKGIHGPHHACTQVLPVTISPERVASMVRSIHFIDMRFAIGPSQSELKWIDVEGWIASDIHLQSAKGFWRGFEGVHIATGAYLTSRQERIETNIGPAIDEAISDR
jgi:hypothetical protein